MASEEMHKGGCNSKSYKNPGIGFIVASGQPLKGEGAILIPKKVGPP